MQPSVLLLLACVIALLHLCCNQPFDPKASFHTRLAVISVLSTDRDVQFVRVERSYMPDGSDPLSYATDNFVPNATVTLSDGVNTIRFHDTTFARSDTSRFKSPLRAYCFGPFIPNYGISYQLTVQSDEIGSVAGKMTIPTAAILTFGASATGVMERPGSYPGNDVIGIEIFFSRLATGYVGRLLIDYSIYQDGQWVSRRTEVPARFTYAGLRDFKWVTYPQLTHRPQTNTTIHTYYNDIYSATLANIVEARYPTGRIVFNRIVFQLVQVDPNLYEYYLLAHGFNDAYTSRLDQPEYSNITGGDGVFGVYTLDSIVHTLPENFAFNRR